MTDPYFSNSSIIEYVVNEFGYDSVFEFLEYEKNSALSSENELFKNSNAQIKNDAQGNMINTNSIKPHLTWKLQNIKTSLYRESELCFIEKAYWSLTLNYFPQVENSLNISIKMCKPPGEDKQKQEEECKVPKDKVTLLISR